jgi:hypothetical protein
LAASINLGDLLSDGIHFASSADTKVETQFYAAIQAVLSMPPPVDNRPPTLAATFPSTHTATQGVYFELPLLPLFTDADAGDSIVVSITVAGAGWLLNTHG